ncbi:transposase [Cupriavidus sp. LEh21]|nr:MULTISPECIES: transposase [unclassified Cupriavidus]MDK2661835.1 transposase [Cupriavidus sp. LEh21]
MKYCGIDLHSSNSVISVTDEADGVIAEKRLPNELAKVLAVLTPWQAELAGVVVESKYNWYWLVDALQTHGFTVHLAHTAAIEELKHCGDETDARYLAHLLRLGILPTGTILPPEARNVRDLARKRMQLVRSRTRHILAVDNITARLKQLGEAAINQMGFPEDVALALRANVAVIATTQRADRDRGKASSGKGQTAPGPVTACNSARYRPDSCYCHSAGNRNH